MNFYIKQKDTYKKIITTHDLSSIAGVTKQAIQKNKYLKPIFRKHNTAWFIYDDVREFITYQKAKSKWMNNNQYEL